MKMETDIAIQLKNVFENYEIEIKTDEKVIRERYSVLNDISLTVKKGECLAVIGANGAGKSTILRIIAGLLKPEKGEVTVNGRVGSLLDLGAGFHPELTGRDNLRLNASLYNFNRNEFEAKYEEILKFADIGKFIDVPVRCYSQGMYVRLAFSLAIHVDPDILLIDDCLSVGDDNFQLKSMDKALELKSKNKTIIFVTHNFSLARQLCERCIYIKDHQIVQDAALEEVVSTYLAPSKIDKEQYHYLSAKIHEIESYEESQEAKRQQQEQERRRSEEEAAFNEMMGRRQLEEEIFQKALSERRKAEEIAWGQAVAARRAEEEELWRNEVAARREAERDRELLKKNHQRTKEVSLYAGALKLAVAPSQIRLLCDHVNVIRNAGIQTLFLKDNILVCSATAEWRIKKISEAQIACFLRWPGLEGVVQRWHFIRLENGVTGLCISMRVAASVCIENERVEFWPNTTGGVLEDAQWGNKSRFVFLGDQGKVQVETYQDDCVSGSVDQDDGRRVPYFLKTCADTILSPERASYRKVVFNGGIFLGDKSAEKRPMVLERRILRSENLAVDFQEGCCQIILGEKVITTGLGLYTSVFSHGLWRDSTQAKWKVVSFSGNKLTVRGAWPWMPVIQEWQVEIAGQNRILLNVRMKILKDIMIDMQETVLMLPQEYSSWSDGNVFQRFSENMTSDDFFRLCSLIKEADGSASVSVKGEGLPEINFKPGFIQGHRMIVENSAHIYKTQARLMHCLKGYQKEKGSVKAGEMDFFKGILTINN